jgi:hypothetical protein
VKAMTLKDYLNAMLANDAVREQISKHLSKLQQILSEDACHVVQQISDFDLDVIEVSNGVHSEFLQENFSYFERKTLMESLHARLCRMIVFHRLILVVSLKESSIHSPIWRNASR